MGSISSTAKRLITVIWVLLILFFGVALVNRYKSAISYYFKYNLLYEEYTVKEKLEEAVTPSEDLYLSLSEDIEVKFASGFGERLDIFIRNSQDIKILAAGIVDEKGEIIHWAKTQPEKKSKSLCLGVGRYDNVFYHTENLAGNDKFVEGINLHSYIFYSDKVPESRNKHVNLLVEYQNTVYQLDRIEIADGCFGPQI